MLNTPQLYKRRVSHQKNSASRSGASRWPSPDLSTTLTKNQKKQRLFTATCGETVPRPLRSRPDTRQTGPLPRHSHKENLTATRRVEAPFIEGLLLQVTLLEHHGSLAEPLVVARLESDHLVVTVTELVVDFSDEWCFQHSVSYLLFPRLILNFGHLQSLLSHGSCEL